MREVAARAGVGLSTVSRVLRGLPDVAEATQHRVMEAVHELGYEPDMLARSLRRRETTTVGFAIGDIANPVFAEIVSAAESTLREHGYSMLLTNSHGDPSLDVSHIRLLVQRRVDGLIVSVGSESDPATIELLAQLDVPCVVLNREIEGENIVRVSNDSEVGMREAVGHLLEHGHRRIALLEGTAGVRPARERERALAACFRERGLEPTYTVVHGAFSFEHGVAAMSRLLDEARPPTAVVAGTNQITSGALQVVHDRGVALPHDLSFVGWDDLQITSLYEPPLTVVRRDTQALGHAVASTMVEALRAGDRLPPDVVLPTALVRRASVGAPLAAG